MIRQPETHPDHLLQAPKEQNFKKVLQLVKPHPHISSRRAVFFTVLILIACIGVAVSGFLIQHHIAQREAEEAAQAALLAEQQQEKAFHAPTLEAESAIVYDPSTQTVLFSKNALDKRALASITKMMTALVAHQFVVQNPNQVITITPEDLATQGDSGLKEGERWKLSDLVNFMLVVSSNDAATAIAHHLVPFDQFIDLMNTKAKTLGATMEFHDPAGLDNETETVAGAVGSAQDVALLMTDILKEAPDTFTTTNLPEHTFTSLSGYVHKAVNTNEAIPNLPHLIGGKTGFTDLAGGNLAVIMNVSLNKPIILVVLGSTVDGRFKDIEALASSTLQYFGS